MTELPVDHIEPASLTAVITDLARERRRPGRKEVDPSLLPLLRGTSEPAMPDFREIPSMIDSDWESRGSLKPARGIALGLLLSLPLWGAVIGACHVILSLARSF